MNKWEQAFFRECLLPLERAGSIVGLAYESHKLKIGHRCWYTPDFSVDAIADISWLMLEAGECGFVEVKGHWRDDARVKVKAAARIFPSRVFICASGGPGRWKYERIKPR